MKFSGIISLTLISSLFVISGCDQYRDVNGSFEEAPLSGRLTSSLYDDSATRRYFRFHLRQFDDAIGGTFETFDLDSYQSFTRVPEFMNQTMTRYYCARIDSGYVRGNEANISFTDREQRHWTITLDLNDWNLHGQMARTDLNRTTIPNQLDYLLPEDAAYMREQMAFPGKNTYDQLLLNSMGNLGDRPLDCIYYFKSREIDFILPSTLDLNTWCDPSPQKCHNLRLAVIGTQVQYHVVPNDLPPFHEIMAAYLDDCDVDENGTRTIRLRENPHVFHSNSSGLFVATAIVYQDLNNDGNWDKADEPILASLDQQSLVFYEKSAQNDVYGYDPHHHKYSDPILKQTDMQAFPGWQVFDDVTENTEDNMHVRILKTLTPNPSRYLYLKAIHLNPETPNLKPGCYIRPNTSDEVGCSQLLPILMQQ